MSSYFQINNKSIFIPGLNLYLDAKKKKPFGFISHGHSDHIARHEKILCTPQTASLINFRLKNPNCFKLPFFQKLKLEHCEVSLFPAGHILGSTQIFIESEKGSLLYTGDFRTKKSHTVEPFHFQSCDTLIMETTFGLPYYIFPPREEVEAQLVEKVREQLAARKTPVVFAYSLGKGQEALYVLTKAGLPVAVDYQILRYVPVYEKYGVQFGAFEKFRKSEYRSKVLLLSTQARNGNFLKNMQNKFTIYLSGWGMDDSAKFRLGVDEVLPFSDHADFNELLELVEKTNSKTVYCTHGFDQFVRILKEKGFDARYLIEPAQTDLFD